MTSTIPRSRRTPGKAGIVYTALGLGTILLLAPAPTTQSSVARKLTRYQLTDLGPTPGNQQFGGVFSINDAGNICGWEQTADGQRLIFRQHAASPPQELPFHPPGSPGASFTEVALGQSGAVVGRMTGQAGRPLALWRPQDSAVRRLAEASDEFDIDVVTDVNDQGCVVGFSRGRSGVRAICLNQGQVQQLSPILPNSHSGKACAVNDRGQIVGECRVDNGTRAFLWQEGQVMELADLPGGGRLSRARDINNNSQVVGIGYGHQGYRAVLWERDRVIDLGDLPGGPDHSAAFAINDCGWVVGESQTDDGMHAILYHQAQLIDLNTLVDESAADWVLHRATDINNDGWIVGCGTIDGRLHGFLLTPLSPETPVSQAVATLLLLLTLGWGHPAIVCHPSIR